MKAVIWPWPDLQGDVADGAELAVVDAQGLQVEDGGGGHLRVRVAGRPGVVVLRGAVGLLPDADRNPSVGTQIGRHQGLTAFQFRDRGGGRAHALTG